MNDFNLLGLRLKVLVNGCFQKAWCILVLRGHIEDLEKGVKFMDQVRVLVILIVLGDVVVDFFEDI